ncbi:pimeloyl-CoA dehydrogenase small subunit [Aestuariicella hydrocarbonica]|uniref:Pimeloyl-CoA dehydrogenase small subunit n=1 Tax=Pseudomaricurvus hydrocarbonicus TaxID=1470433 RepID=A0A9E5JXN3_9GAMM|nr:acyl-CoA dehydrogenase [Aestuariicella hydrocarbonica]NHO66850.1 pimeloyl-CoA dehydrogenase small subunit [Aestuariicella hydrocarbonica]
MYIEFSDEQRMLKDSAEKYLQDNYDFDGRQVVVNSEAPFSMQHWSMFANLGWLAMTFEEEVGGFGGGALETMLLSEQLGTNLVVEPYVETIVLGGQLIARGGSENVTSQCLDSVMAGEYQLAFAWAEKHHAHAMQDIALIAKLKPQENPSVIQLNGHKTVVLNGAAADGIIVLARTAGNVGEMDGLSLVFVPVNTKGCERRSYKTHDGRNAAEFTFNQVQVPADHIIGKVGQAQALLKPVMQQVLLSLCAEAVGAMSSLLTATVDYTKQRQQFGRSIAQFQVLRHRMADMFMELELSRSLMLAAAWKLDQGSDDAERCLSALKAKIAKAGKFVSHNAIQLHGGIATTDELNVGHFFKRIAAINSQFGTRDDHLSRFSASFQY